ncbi:hypothetical protein SCLARK_001308 [Spiroplasma clarkii]|nr:hypothetical protein SCLARK_001308 [Spiroplasma clarkii]
MRFLRKYIAKIDTILDPFAGAGDLFLWIKQKIDPNEELRYVGYDIDSKLGWSVNDSLTKIPILENAFIVTNPPYLSKNSCSRNNYIDTYNMYFIDSEHPDLYLIALEKMIETGLPGIAIVPETIINSKFSKKNINKIVVIEPNPFEDTEVPICVVCFNGKTYKKTRIFKNDKYIGVLDHLIESSPSPKKINLHDLRFNDILGTIAIKGIDSTDPKNKIEFLDVRNLKYDVNKIKNTSRAITIVSSMLFNNCDERERNGIIEKANEILNNFRKNTNDVLLSPFKGNNKESVRRRRMDFALARNILELAYSEVILQEGDNY